MKFLNNVTQIKSTTEQYVVIDNSTEEKSCLIITIQIINNSSTAASVQFKRKEVKNNRQGVQQIDTAYKSTIQVKEGTTILDHLVVVPPHQKYIVSSNTIGIVISCSYGI